MMNHSDILLAFALPPTELATDLQRALSAPALAMLTARAKTRVATVYDEYARALPHEIWLAKQSGLASTSTSSAMVECPPLVGAVRTACAMAPEAGNWFLLTPVQLHVARDHLVLADRRQLEMSEDESRALFDTASPLFEEFGHALRYATANTWLLRADGWSGLSTSTPDTASGHNIDIWLPKGTGEREWRRLQNEVQMAWHDHAINQLREQRGQKPVNSLWLWAGTPASSASQAASTPGAQGHTASDELFGWSAALADIALLRADPAAASPLAALQSPGETLRHYDGSLISAAMAADWSSWLARMHQLEAELFAPALAALKSDSLASMRLVFTHGTQVVEFTISKTSLARFWIKPSLGKLFK